MPIKIKNIHIFGGGTVAHIANHFAVCAPAYGTTARHLNHIILRNKLFDNFNTHLELTRMGAGYTNSTRACDYPKLETNEDVAARIEELKKDPNTKIIFFSCALVDFKPALGTQHDNMFTEFGKYTQRLESKGELCVSFVPTEKIISNIRNGRKDIFLVGFKTTCGATKQEMYEKGLRLCKEGSVNLVLVNDTKTRWNMIVTPEEAAYHESADRDYVLRHLVDMTFWRSHLTFTQSTVVAGEPIPWSSEQVPSALRQVVDYAINKNAYKPFMGKTVGHFAHKLSDTEFLTSIRKTNFNELDKTGLVRIKTDGPDTVLAYGAKPSVGGQSQRIVFKDHKDMDCIVHFHCPLRENHPDEIISASQREVECGSHQCGQNTSSHLKQFGNLKAVMLLNHGPNIVFNKNIDPQEVIDFIERNFDLSKKTGGYNLK